MEQQRLTQLCRNVEQQRPLIFDAHDYLWAHAASGFREWEASDYLSAAFERLGYTLTRAGNIPGFYADLDTGRPGPRVLLIAEMDSLIIPTHPDARPETGCVHACGHHAQSAALLGVAAALREPGALDGLCGNIRLMAVPAEELTELPYREQLRRQGVIRYFGGKQEFIARGYMDGCDLACMIHTNYREQMFSGGNLGDNGMLIKTATFVGKAAHAAYAPDRVVNALTAANLALSALSTVRETFRESDHFLIQLGNIEGNDQRCTLEFMLRGVSEERLHVLNHRVNRALAGAAAAVGAGVELSDRAGSSPLHNDRAFREVFARAAALLDPEHPLTLSEHWSSACTDMGDVSTLMPTIHPYCGGAAGPAHTAEYRIASVERACVNSAKGQVVLLELLLENDAAEAKRICAGYSPLYANAAEYIAAVDLFMVDRPLVAFGEDGSITLNC